MKWFRKNFGILPALIDALIQKPDTVAYPFAPLELSEQYRGAVEIHAENCVGCGLCVRDCPAMALELNRQSRAVYQLIHYPTRCTSCGQCEQVCPHDAIYLANRFIPATEDPQSTIIILKDTTPPEEESTD